MGKPGILNRMWSGVRSWFAKYVGGMFMEPGSNGDQQMSIGRVSYFVVLCAMIWVWRRAVLDGEVVALPPGMLEAFYGLLAYVTGSKITGLLKMRFQKGRLAEMEAASAPLDCRNATAPDDSAEK